MKTKAEIIQRLLEAKQIDAEEAMTLMMAENQQVIYIPYTPTYPQYPTSPNPFSPIFSIPPTISGTYA